MFSNHQIVIAALIGSMLTIAVGTFYPHYLALPVLIFVIAVSLTSSILSRKYYQLVSIVLLVIFLSLLRCWFIPRYPTDFDIDFWNDEFRRITIEGSICDEPDIRHTQSKYTVCTDKITVENDEYPVQGSVLISTYRWPEFSYTDHLRITGILRNPFESEEFSYRKYLARYGIYSEMRYPHIQKIGVTPGNYFYSLILRLKNFYANIINQIFPEPQAAFLDGLLRGARKGLPTETSSEFQRTGLTHIVAVSGFNITIIAAAMMSIFGRWHRRLGIIATLSGIVFFVIFTGMSPAVVRAGIMGGIAALAILTGRQNHAATALLLTAVIMIFRQPLILWYDVGFQLSFLSTAGLIFISPFLEKFTQKIPNFLGLKEAFLLTISAQIAVLPLIALHFGRISIIAPLANLAVAPFIVFSMAAGFLAVSGGLISIGLGMFLGVPAYLSLSAILQIAHLGSAVSWADIEVSVPPVFIFLYYLILVITLVFLYYQKSTRASNTGIS